MSLLRDVGAQLTASTAAYAGSFFTFNALLAKLMQDEAHPDLQLAAPPLAQAVSSLLVQRFMRAAEMGPGWTRAVAPDAEGATAAAINTKTGFAKTAAQYWPFFGPLLWTSLCTPDPATAPDAKSAHDRGLHRVEMRRNWGFAASALVALHRIYAFDREHVWLNGSTPEKQKVMLGAIHELTSVKESLTSLGKYAVVRPLAGVAGLIGVDLHPVINHVSEKLYGLTHDMKNQPAWASSDDRSGLLSKKGSSFRRFATLWAPMAGFSLLRRFGSPLPDYSNMLNVANDAVLIAGWGGVMADMERHMASKDGLAEENGWRAQRQLTALARRAPEVAPQNEEQIHI